MLKLKYVFILLIFQTNLFSSSPQYCGDEGTSYPRGDINFDCRVNLVDLSLLVSQWLKCSDPTNISCEGSHGATRVNIDAIQQVYINGVPHTDRRGNLLLNYNPSTSFFPVIMWGAVASVGDNSWSKLTDAKFNTVAPWIVQYPAQLVQWGAAAGLQVILMGAWSQSYLNTVAGNQNLLANVWMDEPTNYLDDGTISQKFSDFLTYKSMANGLGIKVLVSDIPRITGDARIWWTQWATSCDIACHKNYVFLPMTESLASDPAGIAQTVSLAVESNNETKPVWIILGANETGNQKPYRFPTPMQMRAQVYTALIHGATGIAYYTWDNYQARVNQCVGIAKAPLISYFSNQLVATSEQLVQSQGLWRQVTQINTELDVLAGSLLSPTVSKAACDYVVNVYSPDQEDLTHAPLRTLLKVNPNGGYILMTVNVDRVRLRVRYVWPEPLVNAQRLFESDSSVSLEAGGAGFTERYDPFETHIFQINPSE